MVDGRIEKGVRAERIKKIRGSDTMLLRKNALAAMFFCGLLILLTAVGALAEMEEEKTAVETVLTFLERINQGDLDGALMMLDPHMIYMYLEEGEPDFSIDDPEYIAFLFEEMVLLNTRFMVKEMEWISNGVVRLAGKMTDAVYQMRLPEYEEGVAITTEFTINENAIKKMIVESDPKALELFRKRDQGGIGVWVDWENGNFVFVDVVDNKPAAMAGVEIGDRLIAVDGHLVATMLPVLSKVITYIRGEVGTTVTLSIERNGEMLELTMKREMMF